MAFEIANIKEVGGPGNSQAGGQMYSQFSDADTLATMMASGYLNLLAYKLNVRDLIVLTGTDGANMVQVATNDGTTVTVTNVLNLNSVQAISGPGAVDIVTAVTEITTTGADAFTLADGAVGQIKIVILLVDGGTAVVTPATANGWSTLTMADVGDSATLYFGSAGGWNLIGQGGLGTGPLTA